jgi:asparagine synthase (glutamine-hydrolysing)
MTAILGVFETAAYGPGERAFCDALGSAFGRAGGRVRLQIEPPAILGVAHRAPEPASGWLQPPSFAVDDDFVVLADATLYYVSDLRRALDGRVSANASPSQLILSAFRKFGPDCVDYLEGDFAFLIWDRHSRRVFCARDFTGRRPLFLAPWRSGLVVATSLDSIAALPGFDPQVNLAAVGADAAGLLFACDDETCMRGVKSLRAGHTAQWSVNEPLVTRRFWYPSAKKVQALPFGDAAEHLRDLLATAVTERLSASGPTAVWMSGGRDSTAVFGAGMHALRGGASKGKLVPVCRSHPHGDSGREDEVIDDIAHLWGITPHWTEAQHTPMFPGLRNRTRWSAEAFAPPFEGLTRALAKTGRALGSSVALDGYGGDFLFQVSRIYLSDLVARGRVTTALRDWRAMDGGKDGLRGFFHYGIQPLLPRWATTALRAARVSRSFQASMQRTTPPWIDEQFLRKHSLADRFASLGPEGQVGPTAVEREAQFYLTHQFFARVNGMMAGFALDHGVELRSPLLDRRIVRFALSRPAEERNDAGDHKRLLRAAMRGLLPESVLAPRKAKTGTLASYFAHHMRNEGLTLLTRLPLPTALADAGIVDSAQLARAITRYRNEGASYPHTESLYCTLQAESWLSARLTAGMSMRPKKRRGQAL